MKKNINLGDKQGLSFFALAEVDERLYFVDRDSKLLFCYDQKLKTTELKRIMQTLEVKNSYWMAFSYNREVWFIPVRYYERIAIYDTVTNLIEYVEIPEPIEAGRLEYRPFNNYFIYNNKVYLIPGYYDCILEIDLITRVANRIDIGIKKYVGKGCEIFCEGVQCENIIYMCPWSHKHIYAFNMDTLEVKILQEEFMERKYCNIFEKNKKLILVPEKIDTGIVLYNLETGEKEEIHIGVNDEGKAASYRGSIFDREKDKLFLLPYGGKAIIEINIVDWKIKEHFVIVNGRCDEYMWGKQKKVNNNILLPSESSETPMIVYEDGIISQLSIIPSDDYFISGLLMEMAERNECKHEEDNIGEKIFELIK